MSFLSKAGRQWLKIAAFIGNIQITIFLWLVFWILLPIWALPYKVFSDRLALRNQGRAQWIQRTPDVNRMETMRKQG